MANAPEGAKVPFCTMAHDVSALPVPALRKGVDGVRCAARRAVAVMMFLGLTAQSTQAGVLHWLSPELRSIETQRTRLEQKLNSMPEAPVAHPSERKGWHSEYYRTPDTVEWVDLHLGGGKALDAVVLVAPPAARSGYGFPLRFRVEVFGPGDEDEDRTVLFEQTGANFPNPGSLPVYIPAGGRTVVKVRITATRLYMEGGRCFFALGEVLLLQGRRNLGAELEAVGPDRVKAGTSQGTRPDWGRINLVDGQTVLGPPLGSQPSPTLGHRSRPQSESRALPHPWVMVDLGDVVLVDEVRLFPAHPPAFAHSQGYGFPVRYHLELKLDESELPEYLSPPHAGSYKAPPGDNVVTLVAEGRRARFVQLNVDEPHVSNGSAVLALAEMQVWSGGRNVALGRPVQVSDATEGDGWSPSAVVDGYASLANIVDWPGWLEGLSQRRELTHQLAVLEAQRRQVLEQWQQAGLLAGGGLVAAVLAAAVGWSLRQRRLRKRELEALRERISQDLHDEIGSSLGSISLITQDALSLEPDQAVRRELEEIRDTAQQTLDSMRDIVRLAQSGVYGQGDLVTHLREIAGRMLRGVHLEMKVSPAAEQACLSLPVDLRRDLVLMFKETLHNLTRHARASQAVIKLDRAEAFLSMEVRDDGCGFEPTLGHPSSGAPGGMGLANLRRRAAKHGGEVQIVSTPGCGTSVHILLSLPSHG